MDTTRPYLVNIFKTEPSFLDYLDGTLYTEDGFSFPIHKIVLAKCSKYFFALFCSVGKDNEVYFIPGIRGEVLNNILSFIYNENIHVTDENICNIIVASDYLLLDNLLSHLKTLLEKNLTVKNSLDIHQWLMKMGRKDYLKISYRFIEFHFEELVFNRDVKFKKLHLEFLKQLLNDRNLRVGNESVIWRAIVKWVEADFFNRLHRVPDLLMCLRMMDVDEGLAAEILTHAIVSKNTFCKAITFSDATTYNNIFKFHQYFVWNDTHIFSFYAPRKPLSLNFISYYFRWPSPDKIKIYVTYDENIDLWRKIIEVNLHPNYLVCLNDRIYLFEIAKDCKACYNIKERQWVDFKYLKVKRRCYAVVTLSGCIYVMGGIVGRTGNLLHPRSTYDVEIYDPKKDAWHNTMPMLPVYRPRAVTLDGFIYVVVLNIARTGMSSQMYDPSTQNWRDMPEPSFYRGFSSNFALAAYNEKVYLIGGSSGNTFSKIVEVFDPLHFIWSSVESLPHEFIFPRALVINDRLIVCEDPTRTSFHGTKLEAPVQWNKENGIWEVISESTPLYNIHHYLFVVEDGDNINVISKDNKSPTADFEKRPFV